MKNIKILDCTLRDGGYVNDWNFGKDNINKIISNLQYSNIDFIEVGYLNENVKLSNDSTQFNDILNLNYLNNTNNNFLCMIDFGKYDASKLLNKNQTKFDGIRVAFHKKDMIEALKFCEDVKNKGYKVFVQPMVTMNYSNEELEQLVNLVNHLNPYSLYIVDSFGYMNNDDIKEKAMFVDSKLNNNIILGFHSHNNLQLAYSNALTFINCIKNREIIVDSSIYGMGRGAGNLNTELIIDYINKNYNSHYKLLPILEISEEILSKIKAQNYWGYSLEYYLSAIYHLHPNYSKYLIDKKTLSLLDVEKILNMIEDSKKSSFDREYIGKIYDNFISNDVDDNDSYEKLKNIIRGKSIVVIGNGMSVNREKNKILNHITSNSVVISINNIKPIVKNSILFISNKKRVELIDFKMYSKIIYTSNIEISENNAIKFDYNKNLAKELEFCDNSLLILLNILIKSGVNKVSLAGFDGFDVDIEKNFFDNKLLYNIDKYRVNELNKLIKEYIKIYTNKLEIQWITKSKYMYDEEENI